MTPLETAIEKAGGQAALGRAIAVPQPLVWYWLHQAKHVPAEHCAAIEEATGVSRHDLRPDIFGETP